MRIKLRLSTAFCGLLALAAANAQEDRHSWSIDLAVDALSAEPSARLSPAADPDFARAAFIYSGVIKPTLTVNAVVDAVDDGSSGLGVTQAYLSWRPVPRSPFRHAVRAGAFYPPLSLENTDPGWTSPYSGAFSALNTWVGEELRTIGGEWSVSRPIGPRAAQKEIRLIGAAYYGNDPAGALLSWRGFALHERQSRLGDAIDLPAVPQIQPGMLFRKQAPATKPFVELDHAPGFYYGAEWRLGRRVRLTGLKYDNHAEPTAFRHGQYGWTTRFDHVGAEIELPAGLGFVLQWMDGTTVMGPVVNGAHVVDNAFESCFALLTRKHGRHRWSLRFDDFDVADLDATPLDDNSESGDALTAAYRYELEASWSLGVEWLALDLTRPAETYFGRPASSRENLFRLEMRYRLQPGQPPR
jgi:hypothetical protein